MANNKFPFLLLLLNSFYWIPVHIAWTVTDALKMSALITILILFVAMEPSCLGFCEATGHLKSLVSTQFKNTACGLPWWRSG